MNVFAIYAVNQHLADLHEEARQARLADTVERPSLLSRIVDSVRSAVAGSSAGHSPTAASAA